MEILTEIKKTVNKKHTIEGLSKINKSSEELIANIIIDAFNEHVLVSKEFKQKMAGMINIIEFTYPDDRFIIKKAIDSFLESSHQLMGDRMESALDLYLIYKKEKSNGHLKFNDTSHLNDIVNSYQNDKCMKEWLEQSNLYKLDIPKLNIGERNIDDFCHYLDISETFINA